MSVYNENNFSGRVNYAATVILREGNNSRSFDTCFEMYDGAAVAAALWRRAQKNAKLAAILPRYINADMAREDAEQYSGRNLNQVSQELRAAAKPRAIGTGIKSYPLPDGTHRNVHPSGYECITAFAWDEKRYQKIISETRRRVAGRMALGNYGVPSYGRDEALRPLPLTAEFMTLPRHVMQ